MERGKKGGLLISLLLIIGVFGFSFVSADLTSGPYCGDTIVNQASEECDDGNKVNNDACDNECQSVEQPCNVDPSVCNDENSCTIDSCVLENDAFVCQHTFSDLLGPTTSSLAVSKVIGQCKVKIEATETDTCSNIIAAEYFIDGTGCGTTGTGKLMLAKDGSFNSLVEDIIESNTETLNDGSHNIYVRGKDAQGNWGACKPANIALDCLPPDYPTCQIGNTNPKAQYNSGILLNNQCNPHELLVCNNNPTLTANICDSQSTIQLAEYFLDNKDLYDWYGIEMSATDGTYLDEQCEDVQAVIDLAKLSDGTHYVQLHGKDSQETWGKLNQPSNPLVSFIKDSTSPKTEKVLTPKDEAIVKCDITSINSKTLTNGCAYVKTGTTITLTSNDFNPDEEGYNNLPGEYSGNVVIHYRVYWSLDGSSWEVKQSGDVSAQPVTITLNEDSYHLVEYWATDGCGNEETHHYELDIVDTKAPVTTEVIKGPIYSNGVKTFLDRASRVELTCKDALPHPVGREKIFYRYSVDGVQTLGWTEYTGEFGFPEESNHVLEYYCKDALGNIETTHSESYSVDHTAPVTSLAFGTPLVNYGGFAKWITSQTPVTLTANDPDTTGFGCNSGVYSTKYRVTKLTTNEACLSNDACQITEGNGEWKSYSSPFTVGESSCHLIEYYSSDNVEKTEVAKRTCVFVDNEKPVTTKIVGFPRVFKNDGADWWITQNTKIDLTCHDVLPHPVDSVTLHVKYNIDGGAWIDVPTSKGYVQLQFDEDSNHTVEWYCSDALGNSEVTRTELDRVDTAAPEINKWIQVKKDGEKTFGQKIYGNEESPSLVAVRSGDEIKFCADVKDKKLTGDKGVGVWWVKYQLIDLLENDDSDPALVWDEKEQAYCATRIAEVGKHCTTLEDCGYWRYEVKAMDLLGNAGKWKNGIEILIDNVAPVGEVLNPHAGAWYADGKTFAVYAPAVDFGGDYCTFFPDGENCPASGVDYCDLYAVDYNFEAMNQSKIKDCYQDLKKYFEQIGANPKVVYLGRVPYENGVCKGYANVPEDSGLNDTVFLGISYVDKAGNGKQMQLALNPGFTPITMNIDNKAPKLGEVTGSPLNPVRTGDYFTLTVDASDNDAGLFSCEAVLEGKHFAGTPYLQEKKCYVGITVPSGIKDGSADVEVRVQDTLGNTGKESVSILVDNTVPMLNIVSPTEDSVVGATIPVDIELTDNTGVEASKAQYRITDCWVEAWGLCFGKKYDSGWRTLTDQSNGHYTDSFDTVEEGLESSGKYIFGVRFCDVAGNCVGY
jgi:cysteine-rich repeat protein